MSDNHEYYCEARQSTSGWIAVVTFRSRYGSHCPIYITTPFVSGSVMPYADICDKTLATQLEAADDAIRWCKKHGMIATEDKLVWHFDKCGYEMQGGELKWN